MSLCGPTRSARMTDSGTTTPSYSSIVLASALLCVAVARLQDIISIFSPSRDCVFIRQQSRIFLHLPIRCIDRISDSIRHIEQIPLTHSYPTLKAHHRNHLQQHQLCRPPPPHHQPPPRPLPSAPLPPTTSTPLTLYQPRSSATSSSSSWSATRCSPRRQPPLQSG